MKLKQISQLKPGKCQVIVKGSTKKFSGEYDAKLGVVFMTIPAHYEIEGYLQ